MNNTEKLKQPGEYVTVRRWDQNVDTVRVVGAYPNIKNGRAGYDLEDGTWCYVDQTS